MELCYHQSCVMIEIKEHDRLIKICLFPGVHSFTVGHYPKGLCELVKPIKRRTHWRETSAVCHVREEKHIHRTSCLFSDWLIMYKNFMQRVPSTQNKSHRTANSGSSERTVARMSVTISIFRELLSQLETYNRQIKFSHNPKAKPIDGKLMMAFQDCFDQISRLVDR